MKVTNFLEGTVGNLSIEKQLAGNAVDPDKAFALTVNVGTISGDREYSGTGGNANGTLAFSNGTATFELKGGQGINIMNLPKDAAYMVTENDYSAQGYVTEIFNGAGTIDVDNTQTVTVTNTRNVHGRLEINKEDQEGALLKDADFRVLRQDGENWVVVTENDLVTDEEGKANLDNLPPGQYQVRETKAPEGYYLNTEEKTFTVDVGGLNEQVFHLTFTNQRIPVGNLVVNKLNALTGTPMEGITFEYGPVGSSDDSTQWTKTAATDSEGKVEIPDLLTGNYYLREISRPVGYHPLEADMAFIITLDNSTTVNVENHPLRNLQVIKTDAANNERRLGGAIFQLQQPDGTVITQKVTDSNGMADMGLLAYGTYRLVETQAPAGYLRNATPLEIVVDEDTPGILEVTWPNTRRPAPGPGPGQTPVTDPDPDADQPGDEPVVPPAPGNPAPPTTPPADDSVSTPENTPVEDTINIPETSIPVVVDPPQNGTVEIDEDGNWRYTPNPGFTGKERFTVRITHEDGTEEDIIIEIDVDPIPEGSLQVPGVPQLPSTGEPHPAGIILLGLTMTFTGLLLHYKSRRRHPKGAAAQHQGVTTLFPKD